MQANDPAQGWKIHVSATLLSASEVFSRVRPILVEHDVLFKVPARLVLLAQLNLGLSGFSQVGKFLTVYPRSIEEALELARELHIATGNLCGPEIPFDARYRKNSLVYYRYGSFRRLGNGSAESGIIFDRAGKPHKDRREPGHAIPRWIDNPFKKCRSPSQNSNISGLLGADYLPFKAIMQRGKGGVYEAVDLSVSPARLVIIKEGRRHGETTWDGEDGQARLKHESHVLRSLRAAGVPTPEVFHEFSQNGNRYLVLEKIAGRPLLTQSRTQPAKMSWRRAQKILEQVSALLARVHAAGWVWRDCKPAHIFLHRGMMRLIDFEGACKMGETQVLPWRSPHSVPPVCREKFSRRAGVLEDDYALGVIAFQLATAAFPPLSPHRRTALYRRSGCPIFLQVQIDSLLRS